MGLYVGQPALTYTHPHILITVSAQCTVLIFQSRHAGCMQVCRMYAGCMQDVCRMHPLYARCMHECCRNILHAVCRIHACSMQDPCMHVCSIHACMYVLTPLNYCMKGNEGFAVHVPTDAPTTSSLGIPVCKSTHPICMPI
jgi:hypothetical protein